MSNWEVETMTEKKSFVAYYSWWDVISKLDDHQKALVLEAMFSTGGVCDKPELDLLSEVVFIPIEREITANIEKWEKTREARREAGRKGGKASGKATKREEPANENEEQANQAIASFAKQTQANENEEQAKQAVDVDVDADVDVDVDEDVVININAAEAAMNEQIPTPKQTQAQEKAQRTKTARQHFEELWALYPNKRGKSEITDDMKESLMSVSVDQMKEAVNRYIYEVRTSTYERNWMNGSTWFKGRFLDYVGDTYQPPPAVVKARKGQYISKEGFREFGAIEE